MRQQSKTQQAVFMCLHWSSGTLKIACILGWELQQLYYTRQSAVSFHPEVSYTSPCGPATPPVKP